MRGKTAFCVAGIGVFFEFVAKRAVFNFFFRIFAFLTRHCDLSQSTVVLCLRWPLSAVGRFQVLLENGVRSNALNRETR